MEIQTLLLGKIYGSPYYNRATVIRRARREVGLCKECGQPIRAGELYVRKYSMDWHEHFIDYEATAHLDCVRFVRPTRVVDRKGRILWESAVPGGDCR